MTLYEWSKWYLLPQMAFKMPQEFLTVPLDITVFVLFFCLVNFGNTNRNPYNLHDMFVNLLSVVWSAHLPTTTIKKYEIVCGPHICVSLMWTIVYSLEVWENVYLSNTGSVWLVLRQSKRYKNCSVYTPLQQFRLLQMTGPQTKRTTFFT